MSPASVILAAVTTQRVLELAIARRNTHRLLARGAVETGAGHYPLLVGLHVVWLTGLWFLAWEGPVQLGWLAVYLVLQGLRVWTMASLGGRWTTRILTVPGAPLVRRGPYRFLSHPNYVVVIGEIAVLPLVFGLETYAAIFTALNAGVLWIRVRAENAALRTAAAD